MAQLLRAFGIEFAACCLAEGNSAPEPELGPEPEPPTCPLPPEPEDEAWQLATSGRPAEAYSRLAELSRARPERTDLALRLYWLLAVHPSLDSERTRHDWLAAALKHSHLSGPAVELYRRELDANPEAALFGPYLRILEVDASPAALLSLARPRLVAAGVNRGWNVVEIDLGALATRAAGFDESAWLSYLVGAMSFLNYEPSIPAYNHCRSLLAGLRHLELREGWAFDQLEEQDAMARTWREAHAVPAPVREVVRVAWTNPGGWRKAMGAAAAWVAEDPAAALQQLELAASQTVCGPVLATFQRLLADTLRPGAAVYPAGIIRGLVREFLARHSEWSYHWLRAEVIRFLIAEAIDPEELVQACIVDTTFTTRAAG